MELHRFFSLFDSGEQTTILQVRIDGKSIDSKRMMEILVNILERNDINCEEWVYFSAESWEEYIDGLEYPSIICTEGYLEYEDDNISIDDYDEFERYVLEDLSREYDGVKFEIRCINIWGQAVSGNRFIIDGTIVSSEEINYSFEDVWCEVCNDAVDNDEEEPDYDDCYNDFIASVYEELHESSFDNHA